MENKKIETIVIYPSRQRIELNDKATKQLFNLTPEKFAKLVKGAPFGIVETKKKNKKSGKIETIISGYTLVTAAGFTFVATLDEYERAVLNVCVTEKRRGIYHACRTSTRRFRQKL